ncbi:MAG: histidine phosphatase family protein [Minisyncoccia bacterium]
MKKLVVVRHGYYVDDSKGNLSPDGRQQVDRLGAVLAPQLNGYSVALLSSMAPRAKETSEILAGHLGGIAFEEHLCLWSGGGDFHNGQEEDVLRLVEERGQTHDVVVLSTHLEFIDYFPTVWGKEKGFEIKGGYDTPKGTARVIDVATGQEEHVRPARS